MSGRTAPAERENAVEDLHPLARRTVTECRQIGHELARPVGFTMWEARVAADEYLNASSGKLSGEVVSRRRKLKLLSHRLPFRPLLRFLYIYVWQKGFLDGREGYYFARLHAMYEFLCVAKTRELRGRAHER